VEFTRQEMPGMRLPGRTLNLQWFGKFESAKLPSILKWRTIENDIEGQLNIDLNKSHRISFGGNVRIIRIDTDPTTSEDLLYSGEPYDEQLAGLFLIDRSQVTDALTIEGQIRGDWYSETQTDWSARMTALYAVDEQKDHVLRISGAKAFRAPLAVLRETTTSRLSMAPLGFPALNMFNVLPADDLENEESYALEVGYSGKIDDDLTLRADGFYQRFSKLIGYRREPDPLAPAVNRALYRTDNIDGANLFGGEIEIKLTRKPGILSAWYAYNDLQEDQSHQNMRAYGPVKHKVGLTGRLFLSEGWTLNANYRYSNTTPAFADTLRDIGASHRLDLAVAKEFANGSSEFMIGVSDVLNETNETSLGMGQLTAHEIPGRTFFARLQYRF